MEQDRQLRDRFDAIDEAALKRLVEEKAQESTGLEFKSWGKDGDNKTNLAKLVSGFANGEGGICIWGIRESSGGSLRTAASLAPIEDAARALDRLNDWTADATSPRHPNVYHEVISGKFIKTLVLATDGQPVMARFGIDQYRVRVATRNMAMEHFQIADMFGRRARPVLTPDLIHIGVDYESGGFVRATLALRNCGRAMAEDIAVAIKSTDSWRVLHSLNEHISDTYFFGDGGEHYWHWTPAGRSRCHVGQCLQICDLEGASRESMSGLQLDVIVMSRNMLPHKVCLQRTRAELLEAMRTDAPS